LPFLLQLSDRLHVPREVGNEQGERVSVLP
jgi:hypothetical protein